MYTNKEAFTAKLENKKYVGKRSGMSSSALVVIQKLNLVKGIPFCRERAYTQGGLGVKKTDRDMFCAGYFSYTRHFRCSSKVFKSPNYFCPQHPR